MKLLSLALTAAFLLTACNNDDNSSAPDKTGNSAPGTPLSAQSSPKETIQQASDNDSTLIIINDRKISKEYFDIYFQQRSSQTPGLSQLPQAQLLVLDELIRVVMLSEEASKKGLRHDPKIQAALTMQEDLLLSQLGTQTLRQEISITDEDIRDYYDNTYLKASSKEYNASHILVEHEEIARNLLDLLEKGAPFDETAMHYSTDTTKSTGGSLGWFGEGKMVKPFYEATTQLEKGSYTLDPVKTRFGWHIIKLNDIRDLPVKSYDEMQDEIRTKLERSAFEDKLRELRDKSNIDSKFLLDRNGKKSKPEMQTN